MDLDLDQVDTVADTSRSEIRVWLVKVPQYLADRLEEIEEDNADLGAVKIVEATKTKPAAVSLELNENGPLGDLPKQYELQFLHAKNSMYVFTENGLTRKVIFEGKVEREFQTRPVLNDEYRKLMKTRNEDSNRPKRTIQVVDNVQDGVKLGIVVPLNENELMKRKKKISPDMKKERLPRPELMDLLFTAFEKYTHWNLKGLVEYSQQPTIYLREVLNDICIYLKRGPYKSMYQLKPEYRKNTGASSSSISPMQLEEDDGENEEFEIAQ